MSHAGPGRASHDPRLLVLVLVLGPRATGCIDSSEEPGAVRVTEPPAEPAWNPEVRRPPWTFVFEKTGPRCTVFRIDGGERKTKIEEVACPVDMEVGERLRLAGKTCLREGGGPAREIPVTCPDPLTNAEIAFLEEKQKKGELPSPSVVTSARPATVPHPSASGSSGPSPAPGP